MGNSKDNFFVDNRFRKNDLSDKSSSIIATVHYSGSAPSRSYNNIHYPDSFSNRVFAKDINVTHITFKDTSNGSSWAVNRK